MTAMDDNTTEEPLFFTTEGDYDYPDLMCDREPVRLFRSSYEPPLFWLIFLVGGAGNMAVVWTSLHLRRRLRTMTEVYLLNLAVADLLFLVTLPLWAADASSGWTFGSALCKVMAAVYKVNLYSGTLLLACISVDRYVVIVRATKARSSPLERRRRGLLVCLGVWLLALLLAVPELVFATTKEAGPLRYCRLVFPDGRGNGAKILALALQVSMGFCLPFAIMAPCYAVIVARLLRTRSFQKHKAMRVVLAVVLAFLLSQLPYNGVLAAQALQASHLPLTDCPALKRLGLAEQVLRSLAYLHAGLNPFLYAFVGVRFRRDVRRLLCARCRPDAANQVAPSKSCRSPASSTRASDSDTSQALSL